VSGGELAEVVRAIARARRALGRLRASVSGAPGVRETGSGMEVHAVGDALHPDAEIPSVELWADAELDDGTARAWSLELRWAEPRWVIEAYLLKDSVQGQEELHAFPLRYADDAAGVARQLAEATRELVALPLRHGG